MCHMVLKEPRVVQVSPLSSSKLPIQPHLSVHLIHDLHALLKGLHSGVIVWKGPLNKRYPLLKDSLSHSIVKIKPGFLSAPDTKSSSLLLIPNQVLKYCLVHSTFSPLICMLVFLARPLAPWGQGFHLSHIWKSVHSEQGLRSIAKEWACRMDIQSFGG